MQGPSVEFPFARSCRGSTAAALTAPGTDSTAFVLQHGDALGAGQVGAGEPGSTHSSYGPSVTHRQPGLATVNS